MPPISHSETVGGVNNSSTNNSPPNTYNNDSRIQSFAPSESTRASYTNYPPSPQSHPTSNQQSQAEINKEKLEQLVANLIIAEKRTEALLLLSKHRDCINVLAPLLWHSFGSVTALLQEIISVYPYLNPPNLEQIDCHQAYHALVLIQVLANHPDIQLQILEARILSFLFPFMNTVCRSHNFEVLRCTSLGVIGTLVKREEPAVISFLLKTEVIPLCIRIIEIGSELSKTVAVFIIFKILKDGRGLNYICSTAERFHAISSVLNFLVNWIRNKQNIRLLRYVIYCYLRLCDESRSKEALKTCLPSELRDDTFIPLLMEDPPSLSHHHQLLECLADSPSLDMPSYANLQNIQTSQAYPTFPHTVTQPHHPNKNSL